jgi:hypothetical protein
MPFIDDFSLGVGLRSLVAVAVAWSLTAQGPGLAARGFRERSPSASVTAGQVEAPAEEAIS